MTEFKVGDRVYCIKYMGTDLDDYDEDFVHIYNNKIPGTVLKDTYDRDENRLLVLFDYKENEFYMDYEELSYLNWKARLE